MTNLLQTLIKKKHGLNKQSKTRARLDDKIVNPLSEFKNTFQKRCAYNDALLNKVYAFDHAGNKYLLGIPGAEFNNVEYIGGLWRIQNKFPHEITNVRGRDFVLSDRLAYTEKTKFDFYSAYSVGQNCYGYFIGGEPDFIVAKYETEHGVFMAYGQTIEQARAFLGIKLYDKYQDLIHTVLSGKNSNREHK